MYGKNFKPKIFTDITQCLENFLQPKYWQEITSLISYENPHFLAI